jgi:hypothetical protein
MDYVGRGGKVGWFLPLVWGDRFLSHDLCLSCMSYFCFECQQDFLLHSGSGSDICATAVVCDTNPSPIGHPSQDTPPNPPASHRHFHTVLNTICPQIMTHEQTFIITDCNWVHTD